jgi:hypothetical protein
VLQLRALRLDGFRGIINLGFEYFAMSRGFL